MAWAVSYTHLSFEILPRTGKWIHRHRMILTIHEPIPVSYTHLIQFSLVSMLQLVDEGIFTLETIVEKMCHAPAQGLPGNLHGYSRAR